MTPPPPEPAWRLLVTEAADGPTNMAIDEALWRSRQAGEAPPTVRFFGWAPPTVSLGYGQPLGGDVDVAVCGRLGVGLVRRPTGGSAIYHDGPERELTYSVVAATADLGVGADLLETYRWIGRALTAGLRALGAHVEMVPVPESGGPIPAFCFARTGRYEIEADGRKLVGSAQRRHGGVFLQHGSILLGVDVERLRAVFPTTADPLASLTTLELACGRRPAFDEVAGALAAAFEREHGLRLRPGGLTPAETRLTATLVAEKYGTATWLGGVA
jgi:lipoyl(octanoyl) transferase